jgi:hypothetical protein
VTAVSSRNPIPCDVTDSLMSHATDDIPVLTDVIDDDSTELPPVDGR